jgi:hypothetical protein
MGSSLHCNSTLRAQCRLGSRGDLKSPSSSCALQANHAAQFDHSADLGGVASETIFKAVVGKFSQQHARGFPLAGVAHVVAILGVDDHDSLLDKVNGLSSSIEALDHETITNS